MEKTAMITHSNSKQIYVYEPGFTGSGNVTQIYQLIDILHFYIALISIRVIWFCVYIIINFNYKANKESAEHYNHNSTLEAA